MKDFQLYQGSLVCMRALKYSRVHLNNAHFLLTSIETLIVSMTVLKKNRTSFSSGRRRSAHGICRLFKNACLNHVRVSCSHEAKWLMTEKMPPRDVSRPMSAYPNHNSLIMGCVFCLRFLRHNSVLMTCVQKNRTSFSEVCLI